MKNVLTKNLGLNSYLKLTGKARFKESYNSGAGETARLKKNTMQGRGPGLYSQKSWKNKLAIVNL